MPPNFRKLDRLHFSIILLSVALSYPDLVEVAFSLLFLYFHSNLPLDSEAIQIANETKPTKSAERLRLSVSVKNNYVYPGESLLIFIKVDNRSPTHVQCIRVALRQMERAQTLNANQKPVQSDYADVVHQEDFYQDIFPLPAGSNYSGELSFYVPNHLKPSTKGY